MYHTLTQYNLWANKLICSYISEAGESKADKQLESSFPTIRKTLYHIWDAQVIWYKRLHGEPTNSWPSQNFNGTLEEAKNNFIQNSEEFVRFTENLDEKKAAATITYHSMDGTPFTNTVGEILMHVMNHGTYHRGQLITMLRAAGHSAVGSTDMVRFFRNQPQL